ncbi:YfhO family protein [Streptomyces sp. NPDC002032]|uniref:YfhO family protein n=2 Tax=unclassified Streptomyces TaxID=2593676 RepID=UPI00368DD5AB
MSALVSMGAYCLAMAVHGTYPFGSRSRAVNDLGNQFVPFHAHLWDLMHGNTQGDLLFNWGSGYGVPFLADFFTYLANPFSWLVGLFPRDHVEFPVFLVTVFSTGLAAFLMTVYLGRLRPGSPWLRAALAVGYAVSAWTTSVGFADPMWMWGLVAFPLLGFAYDWCLRRRRWAAGTLLVSVSWAGNFYTAAMATIGMGLILLVRLVLDERPAYERRRALGRALSVTVVGVSLTAPVLFVTFKAAKASQPAPEAVYGGPPGLRDYLAHLLPGGFHTSAPQISVGVLPLLLVLAYPFMRRVPVKERATWCALIVMVALSYVWTPTILLWHGFALPNGGPYRAAIALTATLVCVAWLALAARPEPRELLAGAGALVVLLVVTSTSQYLTRTSWVLTVVGGAATLVLLLALLRCSDSRTTRGAVTSGLLGTVFLATVFAVLSVSEVRDQDPWWRPKRTLDDRSRAAYRAIRSEDHWPYTRSDPGPHEFADNDPLLLGGQGGAYYSSYMPARTADTLSRLGAGWYIQGRHTTSFTDPAGRAIMGVGSYLDADAPQDFVQRNVDTLPVVTLRRGAPAAGPREESVFARQERVLGADIYTTPPVERPEASGLPPGQDGTWHLPGGVPTAITVACAPGTSAFADVPWFSGTLRGAGTGYDRSAQYPMTRNGLLPLGTVPASGEITSTFIPDGAQSIPRFPVGCLDHRALATAVHRLKDSAPREITAGGHSIGAVFPHRTTGTAVISVPVVDGWGCSVDAGEAKAPGALAGLIAVDLGDGGSRVACSYQPPGLRAGLWVAALALVVLLTCGLCGAVRQRTPRWARGTPPGISAASPRARR